MELCTFFMSSYLRKRNRGSARFSHQLSTWSNHDPPYAKRNNSREKNYSLVQSFATLLCLTHSLTHFIIQENNYCFWVFNPQWNVCEVCLFACLLLLLLFLLLFWVKFQTCWPEWKTFKNPKMRDKCMTVSPPKPDCHICFLFYVFRGSTITPTYMNFLKSYV